MHHLAHALEGQAINVTFLFVGAMHGHNGTSQK